MYRRHTINIEVEALVGQAFDSLKMRYDHLEESVEVLRRTRLSLDEARLLTVEAAEVGAIPGSDILPVLEGFRHPLHAEFAEPTRWSLYNSFTETAKAYSPARADVCYRTLARVFALG